MKTVNTQKRMNARPLASGDIAPAIAPCLTFGAMPPKGHATSRRGATLLVTLGVLTVLSVMVTTFLLTARHQRLSAKHFHDKTVARQALDIALIRAMQFADEAMIASNYVGTSEAQTNTSRRVYPLGRWYSDEYEMRNEISANQVRYQDQDILLVPVTNNPSSFPTNALTVDLLTQEVRRLLPPAITNRLGGTATPLRSGWLTDSESGFRVSFAVLNCSGFVDAHCYSNDIPVATTQRVPRVYFSQQDLMNDEQGVAKDFTPASSDANEMPFTSLSYDPNPSVMPLEWNGVNTASNLGTRAFTPFPKFNINSISNNFLSFSGISEKSRLVVMPDRWFRNVTSLLYSATITNLQDKSSYGSRDAYFGDITKAAWNIVNYMTPSRIPTVFDNTILSQTNYPSRLDYAIEAVPLINEVELKNILPGDRSQSYSAAESIYHPQLETIETNLLAIFTPRLQPGQTLTIEWSNIYAFDVELCYPFAPVLVPGTGPTDPSYEKTHLWMDATTKSPDLFTPTRSPYGWLNDDLDEDGYDSLGEVLFGEWNDVYVANSSPTNAGYVTVTNDVVWEVIQTNAVLMTYVENPEAFDDATNKTEIANAFSALWLLTYTNITQSVTTNQPYSEVLQTTTEPYTNRITQAVQSNDVDAVTTILDTPYRNVDLSDGNAWASYFRDLFNKTSASQFSEYEQHEIEKADFDGADYHVYNCTNQLICFPYVVTNETANGGEPKSIVIRFSMLEGEATNNKDDNTPTTGCAAWLRPMVTVSEIDLAVMGLPGIPETVDEALLIRNGNASTGYYKRWDKPGSISIDDPRDNAWSDRWSEQDATMGDENTVDSSAYTAKAAEQPFIHYDRPFLSIGELGYINVELSNRFSEIYGMELPKHPSGLEVRRDTIDLSTRSGASLIDKFTTGAVASPARGLIQANTLYGEVIQRILNKTTVGEPLNANGDTDERFELGDNNSVSWAGHWTNALYKVYSEPPLDPEVSGMPGWTCFADMLPDLGTNAAALGWAKKDDLHDKTEDVLRGIIDKVSFRQNIFVIVVAAQALSPASTETQPIVLADQRAAVTVIRDAYTGRWTVHSWTWLTE